MVEMMPLFDERLSVTDCPDFEGKRCLLMHIKMPFVISDRSFVSLYYTMDKPDGSLVIISSGRDTEAVVAANASIIKKNVVADNVVNYTRVYPKEGGCEFSYLQAFDIAGSIPEYLKNQGAEAQARSPMT